MTTENIIMLNDDATPSDMLAKWASVNPSDESTVIVIAELFSLYQAADIPNHFSLFRYRGPQEDPTGLLVGLSKTTAIFWRATVGHFWLELNELTFAHEAASLPGTTAPFIAEPKVGSCYRFTRGIQRTVATPFKCSAVEAYRSILDRGKKKNGKPVDAEDSEAPLTKSFHPTDNGFTLLGGGKL